jgi:hypothetical protein
MRARLYAWRVAACDPSPRSIVLHCFVDKKKSGVLFSNKVRRWLVSLRLLRRRLAPSHFHCERPSNLPQVLFGDSLEWFEPEEAAKCATLSPFDSSAAFCMAILDSDACAAGLQLPVLQMGGTGRAAVE